MASHPSCKAASDVGPVAAANDRGPTTSAESLTLAAAIAEVGRLIEEAPRHERREQVRAVVEQMTDGERLDFLIGVFVWAHDQRIYSETTDE